MQEFFIPLDDDLHPPQAAIGTLGAPALAGNLGAPLNIHIGFTTAGVCGSLAASTTGKLTLKKRDDLDGDALFSDITMVESGTGTAIRYVFSGRLISTELITAIGSSVDQPLILTAAVAWTPPGEDEDICKAFDFTVYNSPIRDTDSIPASTDARIEWLRGAGIPHLRAVTGLTGGGTTKLDGAVGTLTSADIGAIFTIFLEGDATPFQHWRIRAGTDATNTANGIVRPTCFHATTNQIILESV